MVFCKSAWVCGKNPRVARFIHGRPTRRPGPPHGSAPPSGDGRVRAAVLGGEVPQPAFVHRGTDADHIDRNAAGVSGRDLVEDLALIGRLVPIVTWTQHESIGDEDDLL